MTPVRRVLLGIDPSMSGTGVTLLLATPREATIRGRAPDWELRCLFRYTAAAPRGDNLLHRLSALRDRLRYAFLSAVAVLSDELEEVLEVVVEDPTDHKPARQQRSTQTAARLGAAAGLALWAVAEYFGEAKVTVYGTREWLPKQHRGGGRGHLHPMRHDLAVAFIRGQVRGLEKCGEKEDDQVMAAGVALYHLNRTASDAAQKANAG